MSEVFVAPTRIQRLAAILPLLFWGTLGRMLPVSWWYSRETAPDGWRVRAWVKINAEWWFWDERREGRT